MKLRLLALTLALTGAAGLPAAELVPGLAWVRAGVAPATSAGSVVVDLRYASDEPAAVAMLASARSGASPARGVILALVSPETAPGLRTRLAALPRCLTVGRTAADFKTDIVVATTAEADRRACDALAAGTPPAKLLVENADKPRYDETALMREHTGATNAAADKAAPEDQAPEKPAEPVVIDAVLQRAVQTYLGLAALRKI